LASRPGLAAVDLATSIADKGTMGRVLIAAGVLGLVGLASASGAFLYYQGQVGAAVQPGDTATHEFEVPKGATLKRLGKSLADGGYLKSPSVWNLYLKLHSGLAGPKAGKHALSRSMNLVQLIETLSANPLPDDFPVTLLEGWRLADTDGFLAGATPPLAAAGAYAKAARDPSRFKIPFELKASNLEGYLYPETYMMPKGRFEVDLLIQRQLDSFNAKFAEPYADEIKKCGRTLQQIVTVASMLEREEPKPENRPTVAGIMYRRLDNGIPLGVDATSRYSLVDWNDRSRFLERLRDPTDPYNSRLKAGLPPGPIGAPSISSLVAALRPQSSSWLYYLHDKDQVIHYAKSGEEHEANRKKYNVY
jgi:UPF0755 protein